MTANLANAIHDTPNIQVWHSDHPDCPAEARRWIVSEAKKGTNEIGFIPRPRMQADYDKGRVIVVLNNADLVCYLLHGAWRPHTRISQLWTRKDARRILHATLAVNALTAHARQRSVEMIGLRCAFDLPASLLWPAVGFALVGASMPNNARGRIVAEWRKLLDATPPNPHRRTSNADVAPRTQREELPGPG